MTGKKFYHYRVLDLLGTGGMGSVYKAFDLKLERFVAIKFLSESLSKNLKVVDRFRNEARNQAKLNHPNIVAVYGYEEAENNFAIIMEYFNGFSLDELITQKKYFSLNEAVPIIKQVLYGVSFAHKHGLIHRDIKPSNILINMSGNVKIMDFGISSSVYFNKSDAINYSGTLIYLSPEQIEGEAASERSDIYSIGLTLFEMLVGAPLLQANNNYEIVNSKLNAEIKNHNLKVAIIPEVFRSIISKAISNNLENRFSNCDEFLSEISNAAAKEINMKLLPRKSLIKKILFSFLDD
ncbi:MAG TPA: serine/threonine-protein kinase [Ignavibacteriaceae bacterium]|nr:serine/threonine-protein kinase [Ignavibacteriaceae bacterium]